jgi:tRNA-binding EMAP/Myf-like protein
MKKEITFEEFLEIESKLEIKIGHITSVESVPKSYGFKLTVDFGNDDIRSVFTNLGKTHKAEELIGLAPFITNVAPSVIKGVNSQAIIMVGINHDELEEVGLKFSTGAKLL